MKKEQRDIACSPHVVRQVMPSFILSLPHASLAATALLIWVWFSCHAASPTSASGKRILFDL